MNIRVHGRSEMGQKLRKVFQLVGSDRSWRGPELRRNSTNSHATARNVASLACPPRLELGTPGLEGRCSIQLSYGHVR
jgi:hypothetical protein